MATRNVPTLVLRGFRALSEVPEDAVEELVERLQAVNPRLSTDAIAEEVSRGATFGDRVKVRTLIRTLLTLYRGRQEYDFSVPDIVRAVGRDLSEAGISAEEQKVIAQRLEKFLDIESLRITAKAFDVLGAQERLFSNVRIFTDLRPVFRDEPDPQPVAAIVTHKLRLTYQEAGESKDFYLNMDSDDTASLREALDRADAKAASLKEFIEATQLLYLDASESDNG